MTTSKDDWRRLPRKDPEEKLDCSLYLRLCKREKDAITVLAQLAGMPVTDYCVCILLRLEERVPSKPGTATKKIKKVKKRKLKKAKKK